MTGCHPAALTQDPFLEFTIMNPSKQRWTLILYEQEFTRGQTLHVNGDEFHYLTNVLRLGKNDTVDLCNGIGTKAQGVITAIHKKECVINLTEVMRIEPPKRQVHLLLAHPKTTALEESVFVASEIGVSTIHVFKSERIVSKQMIKLDKLQKISNEALRISKSAYSARIWNHDSIEDAYAFVQEKFENLLFVFCDETATAPIQDVLQNVNTEHICTIIGPEASFSEQERIWILQLKNCFPVSLGSHILRVPTAVACASFTSAWQKI